MCIMHALSNLIKQDTHRNANRSAYAATAAYALLFLPFEGHVRTEERATALNGIKRALPPHIISATLMTYKRAGTTLRAFTRKSRMPSVIS